MKQRMNWDIPPVGSLFLRTFGNAALLRRGNDEEVILEPSKLLALVAYLAFAPGRTATRDALIDLLWSELEPEAGRHALRQHLWQIKRRVGPDFVVEGKDQLVLKTPIDSDRAEFVSASERSDFAQATALYSGDFFPGYAASGAGEFEEWVDRERAELRSRFVRCADVVVKELLDSHHPKEAVALARRIRTTEPLRQHGWRLLLESLIASGDVLSAGVECDALENMARVEELALEPATRSLIATVRRVRTPRRSTEAPLTLQVELVGREREFSMLVDAWEHARRRAFTTVVIEGPAGVGKTRLLSEFLARLESMQSRAVLVRCNAGSSSVPFSLASDLAEKLGALPGARGVSPLTLRILVALCPALSSAFDAQPHVSSAADLATHRLSAIRELVVAIAAERPLAILVDDLHWADHASRTLLAGLQGSLQDNAVLLCISSRQAVAELASGNTSTIVLGSLNESAVFSLLSSAASLPAESWADHLVETLHRQSRGSPLHIIETLQLALQEGFVEIREGMWSTGDADRLRRMLESGEVLLRRISVLSPAELRLLRTLACAAHPLPEDVALRAGRDAGTSGTAALNGLIHRGLALSIDGDVAIAHDEMSRLVVQGTDPEEQRHIRQQLGKELAQGAPSDPQRWRLAAAQLRGTPSTRELSDLFSRYVSAARRRDDHRSAKVLAGELLGDGASMVEVRSLTRSLSIGTRIRAFGLTRVAGLAGLAVGLAGSAFGLTTWRRSIPVSDFALQVEVRDSTGETLVYRKPLLLGDTATEPPIVVGRNEKPLYATRQPNSVPYRSRPGKKRIWATVRAVPDSGQTEIFVVQSGRKDRRLTFSRGDDADPDWSPDGKFIAFSTSRWDSSGHTDLAIMPAGGGLARQITSGPASDQTPLWSPDGTRLAFVRQDYSSNTFEVCVANVDGQQLNCRVRPPGRLVGWIADSMFMIASPVGESHVTAAISLPNVDFPGPGIPDERTSVSIGGYFSVLKCLTTPGLCMKTRRQFRPRRIVTERGTITSATIVRLAKTARVGMPVQ